MHTFFKHIVFSCTVAPKLYMLCRQIEERTLQCRGVYMDLLYEHNATGPHAANKLSLDVELLQKHTCYADKLKKYPSIVEVYIWTFCMNTLEHAHIWHTHCL